jgi:hypothetical protein
MTAAFEELRKGVESNKADKELSEATKARQEADTVKFFKPMKEFCESLLGNGAKIGPYMYQRINNPLPLDTQENGGPVVVKDTSVNFGLVGYQTRLEVGAFFSQTEGRPLYYISDGSALNRAGTSNNQTDNLETVKTKLIDKLSVCVIMPPPGFDG